MIYLYLRVSTDSQEKEGQGLDAQEAMGRDIFRGQEIRVIKEVRSGRKEMVEERPVLKGALDVLKDGDTIWFYDEDRMARDNGVKKQILKILRQKKAKLKVRNMDFDIYDIQDCLRLGMKGEMDEYMGSFIVQRMKAGRDIAVVKKKRWCSGITPFGYTKKESDRNDPEYHTLIPDPEEAKYFKMMVKMCLDGIGTNKIAEKLNVLGVPTNFSKKGRKGQSYKWKQPVVIKILKNSIYKGEFMWKDNLVEVPALISEQTWLRIKTELLKRKIHARRNTKRFYLLRKLLVCGKCGRHLYGKIKENRGERLYCCLSKRPDPEPRNCGMRSINLDKANNAVWSIVREYILNSKKLKEAIKYQQDESFVDRAELEVSIGMVKRNIRQKDDDIKNLLLQKARYNNISDIQLDEVAGVIRGEKDLLCKKLDEYLHELSRLSSRENRDRAIEEFLSNLSSRVDGLSDQEKYDILHIVIDRVVVVYDEKAQEHSLDVKLTIDEDSMSSHAHTKQRFHTKNQVMEKA